MQQPGLLASQPVGHVVVEVNREYLPRERYGGRHVLYISKYLFQENPLWGARDDDVWRAYRPFLRRINPAFDDSWVLARHQFKAAYAQPVIPCNYREVIPPFETPVPGLYLAIHLLSLVGPLRRRWSASVAERIGGCTEK